MRIGRDIACRSEWLYESTQNGEMALCRMQKDAARLSKPALYYVEGFFRC
jgi:hypothetical protein